MARNRRQQSVAVRFGPALKAVILCLVIGGSAVGYVWQKDQIRQLALQISQEERELNKLRRENTERRCRLDALCSAASLEELAWRKDLGLVEPSPVQVIRLPEPPLEDLSLPAGSRPLQYAAARAY